MHAARLMTLHAAWKIDTEGASAARREIGMIKFFGANVLYNVIDRAMQAHGALGYSTDLPLERMYRMPAPRGSTTVPTRCTACRSPARSCAATSRPRTASRPSTSRPGGRRRGAVR